MKRCIAHCSYYTTNRFVCQLLFGGIDRNRTDLSLLAKESRPALEHATPYLVPLAGLAPTSIAYKAIASLSMLKRRVLYLYTIWWIVSTFLEPQAGIEPA